MDDFEPGDIAYEIDGCYAGLYDDVIAWVLKDGRRINRFRGEGSRREQMVDAFLQGDL